MSLSDRDFTRRMLQTVLTVAGVAILLGLLWAAREALLIIYVSALIAMGFSPLVSVIEHANTRGTRRGLPRWLAILAIYLTIVGFFVLVGLMVIPPLVVQAEALWARLPDDFSRFQSMLINYKVMTRRITLAEAVQNAPNGASSNAVGNVLVAISSAIGGLFAIVTVLILSFYLLVETEPMFEYLMRFVPAGRRADVATVARQAVSKVSAWLRAQFVLAGAMGTFSAVGLGLMGEPYFFVVALIAAIGETIPIVGPVLGGIAAVAVAITVSARLAAMVGVYFLVLHQLEANIFVPKIMERRVGVSPVAVIVALLIGGALWGLVGAILAIPTAAIISVIVEEIAIERDQPLQRIR
jgi:predicted PurR-regulated permease PerM